MSGVLYREGSEERVGEVIWTVSGVRGGVFPRGCVVGCIMYTGPTVDDSRYIFVY